MADRPASQDEPLRRERERMRVMLESIADAVLAVDERACVTFLNPAAEALTGWPAHEALGRPLQDVLRLAAESGGQPIDSPVARVLAEGKSAALAEPALLLARDGTERMVADSAAPLRDEHGGCHGAVIVLRDVAERRQAEQRLRESEAQFRLLAETASDAIVTIDEHSRILYANGGAERIFGHASGEMVGRSLSMLMPERLRSAHEAGMRRYLRTRRRHMPWHGVELAGLHKDGHEIAIEVSFGELTRGGQRLFTGIIRDVTARQDAERERGQLLERLLEADRRKDDFLAMLGHELRNPLAPLANAIEILRLEGASSENREQVLEMMERQLLHLRRLVNDLLDVARITRGRVELHRESVDLRDVVRRAVETSTPLIEACRHELAVLLPSEPVPLEADPIRLEQVFVNLLSNAARYTEPQGRIEISVAVEGEEALVRVRDSGAGMTPELLQDVFELFVQGDRRLDRHEGGLGLGLTLVRRLVLMHGGQVAAYSEGPGQGSELVVKLPLGSAPGP
jgi:PAS domain S-box-containing protein